MPRSKLTPSLCALVAIILAGAIQAAEPVKPTAATKSSANVVELFAGMEGGEIEVKVIPKDATGGNITVKKKTDRPLTIKLHEAFAGVPVLAQGFGGGGLGGGAGGGLGGGSGMQGGGNQGFGG